MIKMKKKLMSSIFSIMKIIFLFLIIQFISNIALAENIKDRIVGTWSNEEESFDYRSLSFRSNGRGFINIGGIAPAIFRWSETEGGINIFLAMPPENPTIYAKLSDNPDRLTLALPESDPQTFWRVSSEEPPDLEEQAKVFKQREIEEAKSRRVDTTKKLDTITAVLDFVSVFATSPDWQLHARVMLGPDNQYISLTKMETQTSLKFTSVVARRELPEESNTTGAYSKKPPEGNFTTESIVPQEKIELFMNWLEERDIKRECAYYVYKTTWGIKGYSQFCAAYINNNPEQVRQTMLFLLEEVFPDTQSPYEVIETRIK